MIENLISISALLDVPSPAAKTFNARYTAKYKKMTAWETVWNYNGIMVVSRAIAVAGILDYPIAIRASFPKSFPKLADTFPYEVHGIIDSYYF